MPRDAKNLKSARIRPDVVGQKNNAEIEDGRIAGPFEERSLLNLRAPLGLVKKKKFFFPFDSSLIVSNW